MRFRPSYAEVASTVALVVALSGTAYAAATITGADVVNGTLSGRDVRNDSLTTRDVRALTAQDFKANAVPVGPGARIEASGGDLTVPSGPDNTFEMDTEGYDTGGMYTAPDDFITVTRTGTYLAVGTVQFGEDAAQRQVRIVVDGDVEETVSDSGSGALYTGKVTALLRLTAGQQVTLGTFSTTQVDVADYFEQNDVSLSLQWMAP